MDIVSILLLQFYILVIVLNRIFFTICVLNGVEEKGLFKASVYEFAISKKNIINILPITLMKTKYIIKMVKIVSLFKVFYGLNKLNLDSK